MAQSEAVREFGFMAPAQAWITFLLGAISLIIGVLALGSPISAARRWVIVSLAGLGIVIAALPMFKIGDSSAVATPVATPAPSLVEVRKSVAIARPEDGTIPLCATLHGRAPVIGGKTLWIAYRKESNNNYFYLLPTRGADDPEAWSTPPSLIGDAASVGESYRFYAFYAEDSFSQFIGGMRAGIRASGGNTRPYVYTTSLPSAVQDNAPLQVLKRNDVNAPCHK